MTIAKNRYKFSKKTSIILIFTLISLLLISLVYADTRVFRVDETKFVKVLPDAIDEDNDKIQYFFSQPLDSKGEWQTDFGDAGEYIVTITATDGKDNSSEEVKIIVEEKNQPPYVSKKRLIIEETQKVDLRDAITDPNNDALSFIVGHPFEESGTWQTTYNDQGLKVITFTVSDGEYEIRSQVEIEILNKIQPPTITSTFNNEKNILANEDELIEFSAIAKADSNDPLFYNWYLGDELISSQHKSKHRFGFDDSGEHILRLEVTSSNLTTTKQWTIDVQNKNRAPKINPVPILVKEGETVSLDLPKRDQDNDKIEYTFFKPLDKKGQWTTTFEDSGIYQTKIIASDDEFETTSYVQITIENVDRLPIINTKDTIEINEGEELFLEIEASDPDNEKVNISIDHAPQNSYLDGNEFSWKVNYNEIERKSNFITNILNALRLEKYLLSQKTIPITINACSSQCSSKQVNLVVHNTNRKPRLEKIKSVTIEQNQVLKIEPVAYDDDNDIIKYVFSEPLNKRSGKFNVKYYEPGKITAYVTATDGIDSTTTPVEITVKKINRAPTLSVEDTKVTVNEGQKFQINFKANDDDNDNLEIFVKNNQPGLSVSNDHLTFKPGYNSVVERSDSIWNRLMAKSFFLNKKFSTNKAIVWLDLTAKDNESEVIEPIKVTIKNLNRAPKILSTTPNQSAFSYIVGKPIYFEVDAVDYDLEELTFDWKFSLTEKISGSNKVKRTFTTLGKKEISVKISDGREELIHKWEVDIIKNPNSKTITTTTKTTNQQETKEETNQETSNKETTNTKVIKETITNNNQETKIIIIRENTNNNQNTNSNNNNIVGNSVKPTYYTNEIEYVDNNQPTVVTQKQIVTNRPNYNYDNYTMYVNTIEH
jgi:hypothetical protein